MNEWKELEIDNLPPDILVGGYEFEYFNNEYKEWRLDPHSHDVISILRVIIKNKIPYRYRKPEPKPTHLQGRHIYECDNCNYIWISKEELKYDSPCPVCGKGNA